MQDVKVTTFNVGQGLFNLVTGTTDDGSPYCGVFDCGNFEEYNDYNCIDQASQILNKYTIIDDVVISHQDEDHWRNLIDLILAVNGYSYNKDGWYRLPYTRGSACMLNFSASYINKCGFKNEADEVYAEHSLNTYDKDISAYAICHVYEKNYFAKSYWRMLVVIDDKNFEMKIVATEEEGIYLISITNSGAVLVPFDDIMVDFIRLIFGSKLPYVIANQEKICRISKKVLGFYFYSLDELKNRFNKSPIIRKYIKNLFLGGLDCNKSYEMFKKTVNNFSVNCDEECAFVSIEPDFDLHELNCKFAFENDILNHKGKKLTDKGSTYKNATSQVTAVFTADNEFLLFPGDTTFHAYRSIFYRLDNSRLNVFLAPHHGSYKSNFAFRLNSNKTITSLTEQPLTKFLTAYPPERIHISANRSRFGHPSESFVNSCEKYCSGLDAPHEVVYCPDGTKDIVVPKTTTKAIYTTENRGNLLFPSPPPMIDNAKASSKPIQLPDNDLFIPYGGFNL